MQFPLGTVFIPWSSSDVRHSPDGMITAEFVAITVSIVATKVAALNPKPAPVALGAVATAVSYCRQLEASFWSIVLSAATTLQGAMQCIPSSVTPE